MSPQLLPSSFTALLNSIDSDSYECMKLLTSLSLSLEAKASLPLYQINELLSRCLVKGNALLFKEFYALCSDKKNIDYAHLWVALHSSNQTEQSLNSFLPYFEMQLKNDKFLQNSVIESLPRLQRNNFDLFKEVFKFLHPKVSIDYVRLSPLFSHNAHTPLFLKEYGINLDPYYISNCITNTFTMKNINSIKDIEELDYENHFKGLAVKDKIILLADFIKNLGMTSAHDKDIYINKFSILLDYFGLDSHSFSATNSDFLPHLYNQLFSLPPSSIAKDLLNFVSKTYAPPMGFNWNCLANFLTNASQRSYYKKEIIEILQENWGMDRFHKIIKKSQYFETLPKSALYSTSVVLDIYRSSPSPYEYSAIYLCQHILFPYIREPMHVDQLSGILKDILSKPQHDQSRDSISHALSEFFILERLFQYDDLIKRAHGNGEPHIEECCLRFVSEAIPHVKYPKEILSRLLKASDNYSAREKIAKSIIYTPTIMTIQAFIEKKELAASIPGVNANNASTTPLKI